MFKNFTCALTLDGSLGIVLNDKIYALTEEGITETVGFETTLPFIRVSTERLSSGNVVGFYDPKTNEEFVGFVIETQKDLVKILSPGKEIKILPRSSTLINNIVKKSSKNKKLTDIIVPDDAGRYEVYIPITNLGDVGMRKDLLLLMAFSSSNQGSNNFDMNQLLPLLLLKDTEGKSRSDDLLLLMMAMQTNMSDMQMNPLLLLLLLDDKSEKEE